MLSTWQQLEVFFSSPRPLFFLANLDGEDEEEALPWLILGYVAARAAELRREMEATHTWRSNRGCQVAARRGSYVSPSTSLVSLTFW
jgi:hypothetical protein